jgi:hypothetical protein
MTRLASVMILLLAVGCQEQAVEVRVVPTRLALGEIGGSAQMKAEPLDAKGKVLSAAPLRWESTSPEVAVVDEKGWVTARGSGSATLVAVSGHARGEAQVSVQVVRRIEVVPSQLSLQGKGEYARLQVRSIDEKGQGTPAMLTEWSTTDRTMAHVGSDGVVTHMGKKGRAKITAKVGSHVATVDVELR